VLQALDAAAVRRWAEQCLDLLAVHRAEIDAINVFPVADADTGTNLLATMTSAVEALRGAAGASSPASSVTALAGGALLGARGNSGLILSQVLRGFADAAGSRPSFTGEVLRHALSRGDELATAAVSTPVTGTVLTVLSAAAAAARACPDPALPAVALAAAGASSRAVSETTGQLAELAAAGVVDAGGRGLELVLGALAAVVTEDPGPLTPLASARARQHPHPTGHGYEVGFLLSDTDPARVQRLRAELERLGDSVVIGGDGARADLVTVHVHARDAGAAVEAGIAAGRPHRIRVEALDVGSPTPPPQGPERALLSVVAAAANAELFRAEGSLVLRAAAGCDAAAVRAGLVAAGAAHVTLLGNGVLAADVLAEAVAGARHAGQRVTVVPTASPVQGLAAIAVHDGTRDPEDDVVAMAEAAAATRRGSVHVAAERGLTWVGQCEPGDVLALVDDDVVLIESEQLAAGTRLLDRMLGAGGELVTVLTGSQAEPGLGELLVEHVATEHRGVELVVYPGWLAGVVLVLGVE